MQQRVVAVDFDDVLMGFNAGFARFHNRLHGTNVRLDDIISTNLALAYQCEVEAITERIREFFHSPEHAEVEPIPGAVEAVEYLRSKYCLDVVTSRPESVRENTKVWIERFFPDTFRTLHFTNSFATTDGVRKRHKSEVCKEIGAAVLIDDMLAHAEEVAKHNIPVLLPDKPWNRDHTPEGVVRVTSWKEIVAWIETSV